MCPNLPQTKGQKFGRRSEAIFFPLNHFQNSHLFLDRDHYYVADILLDTEQPSPPPRRVPRRGFNFSSIFLSSPLPFASPYTTFWTFGV